MQGDIRSHLGDAPTKPTDREVMTVLREVQRFLNLRINTGLAFDASYEETMEARLDTLLYRFEQTTGIKRWELI